MQREHRGGAQEQQLRHGAALQARDEEHREASRLHQQVAGVLYSRYRHLDVQRRQVRVQPVRVRGESQVWSGGGGEQELPLTLASSLLLLAARLSRSPALTAPLLASHSRSQF